MKLKLIVPGLLFAILLGSVAVAASNYSDPQETGECAQDMMEEFCPDEMLDSGECELMMGSGQCQAMMTQDISSDMMADGGCLGMDDWEIESDSRDEDDDYMSSMMGGEGCSGMSGDSASGMAQMMM